VWFASPGDPLAPGSFSFGEAKESNITKKERMYFLDNLDPKQHPVGLKIFTTVGLNVLTPVGLNVLVEPCNNFNQQTG